MFKEHNRILVMFTKYEIYLSFSQIKVFQEIIDYSKFLINYKNIKRFSQKESRN